MKKILFLLLAFLSIGAYSQTPPCGSDAILQNEISKNPLIKEQMDLMNKKISESKKTGRTSAVTPESITVPTVVYVVHNGVANPSNITDTQVNQQLTALNAKFYNTGLKFCLATRASTGTQIPMLNGSDVQTTPGIIHIYSPSLTNNSSSSQAGLLAAISPQVTGDRYLRIWVVDTIDNPSNIAGYAGLPFGGFNGIVILNKVFGNGTPNLLANYNQGEVLVHEVGHYLGLYHTFEGGCATPTGNPLTDGDCVADTPTVSAPNFSCANGINSCPETPAVNDLIHNYMDYGDNVCATGFTSGQIARMNDMINIYKSYMISNANLIYTGICNFNNLVSAEFTPSTTMACQSATVPVTFTSLYNANYTYAWTFGDGGTSTLQNPSHIYATATGSPFTVTLTVTNTSTLATSVATTQIFIVNCTGVTPTPDSYWVLRDSKGLSFNTGVPVFDPTFPTGVTSIKFTSQGNASGNLLFYTNGLSVWNANHTLIGSNISSEASLSFSNSLIVPNPGNANQYYIFTAGGDVNTTNYAASKGFEYSIVPISGGVATTMTTIKQPVTVPSGYQAGVNGAVLGSRGFAAVKKGCGNDYWIITTLLKGTNYYMVVYQLTSTGLSYVSETFLRASNGSVNTVGAKVEASPNGNKLLFYADGFYYPYTSYLYDFNKAAGIIDGTSLQSLPTLGYPHHAASFSPDSKLLYTVAVGSDVYVNRICQYNLNSSNVNASKVVVGSYPGALFYNAMQEGPDHRIYVSLINPDNTANKLAVIHKPNVLVSASNTQGCQYTENGPRTTTTVFGSLPNIIDAKLNTALAGTNTSISYYTLGCRRYKFFPDWCGVSFNWTFGDPASGAANTSTAANPEHIFSAPGTYTVTLKNFSNTITLATISVVVPGLPNPVISGSTTACTLAGNSNNNITSNTVNLAAGQTVVWSIISGTGTITGGNTTSATFQVNWTVLPATIRAVVTDASGCSTTVNRTITSLCPCNCLNTLVFTQSANLDDSCPIVITNTNPNQMCGNFNMRHTWSLPLEEDPIVTYGYNGVNNCSDGTFFVVTDVLDANGNVVCTIKHNQLGVVSDMRPINLLDDGTKEVKEVKITPNPSKGIFNIRIEQYSGKVNIQIHDINGKLIFDAKDEDFNIEKAIDLSKFRTGTYILKMEGENLNYSQKLIKN